MPHVRPYFLGDFLNLLNPFTYSRYNFPPRLHLNNTNLVYICQLWDEPIFMNIIEHIPAVRRWCQRGRRNKEPHLEAQFSQPRSRLSEIRASQPHCSSFTHVLSSIFLLIFVSVNRFLFSSHTELPPCFWISWSECFIPLSVFHSLLASLSFKNGPDWKTETNCNSLQALLQVISVFISELISQIGVEINTTNNISVSYFWVWMLFEI